MSINVYFKILKVEAKIEKRKQKNRVKKRGSFIWWVLVFG